MGKLSMAGNAEREITYDTLNLLIDFCVYAPSAAKATERLTNECEDFLSLITKEGIDFKDIHLGENSIEHNRGEKEIAFCATRQLNIKLNLDMLIINSLTELIKEKDYSVAVYCNYSYSEQKAVHMELLRDALEDSRKKAEFIAEAMGQKITGIDSVSHDLYSGVLRSGSCEAAMFTPKKRKPMLSDNLAAPTTVESEHIEVVWIIE